MAAELIVPNTTAFRVIEKDTDSVSKIYRIYSVHSQSNGGSNLQIKVGSSGTDGVAEFTGSEKPNENRFRVHRLDSGILFESISVKTKNWVLFVNAQDQLSAREKVKPFSTIKDAASDERFELTKSNNDSSRYYIKWKKGNKFIGSDRNGQPILLDKIEGEEGQFYLVPAS